MAALSACAVLAGCGAPAADAPVVRIAEAAKPSPVRALDHVLPTARGVGRRPRVRRHDGPTRQGWSRHAAGGRRRIRGHAGRLRQPHLPVAEDRVRGQPGAGRGEPAVGQAATRTARRTSGFFGVVQFATPDDAQAFFAASADKWHRCNGQTLVLHQPEHGADGSSRITDVVRRRQEGVGRRVARRRFDDPACARHGIGLHCGRGDYGHPAAAAAARRVRSASRTSCCRRSAFPEPGCAEPAEIDGWPTLPAPVGHNSAVIYIGTATRACAIGTVIAASVLLSGCVSTVSGTAMRAAARARRSTCRR